MVFMSFSAGDLKCFGTFADTSNSKQLY